MVHDGSLSHDPWLPPTAVVPCWAEVTDVPDVPAVEVVVVDELLLWVVLDAAVLVFATPLTTTAPTAPAATAKPRPA